MKDKFDKILADKIKKTFENREVAYNPDHWDLLLSKKKDKKRTVFFIWRVAGVALLFVLAGSLGTYLISEPTEIQNNEIEIVGEEQKGDELIDPNSLQPDNSNSKIQNLQNDEQIELSESDPVKPKQNKNELSREPQKEVFYEEDVVLGAQKNVEHDSLSELVQQMANEGLQQQDPAIAADVNTADENLEKDKEKLINDVRIAENDKSQESVAEINDKIDINDLVEANKELDKNTDKKSLQIGLNVSTMMSKVSEYNNSNVGFSSGLTVDIPILKRVDIFTGVLYTNQKFNLNNGTPYLASDPLGNGGIQESSKEATVNGIEIPFNLKYNFDISDKNLFVSAGFSSTSYFKEATETNYIISTTVETISQDALGNNVSEFNVIQSEETVVDTENSNTGFDFASMLNFSIGMEFPINKKRQSLVIEPYFKYSLNTITIQELDYSSAGFYLRYNFRFRKK